MTLSRAYYNKSCQGEALEYVVKMLLIRAFESVPAFLALVYESVYIPLDIIVVSQMGSGS